MSEINVTKETFETEVLKSDKPVLVDFWAPWCGPCKMLSHVISQIAQEHPEVKVCKINIDDEGELADHFGVMSIPTLAVFNNGKITKSAVGAIPKQYIEDLIK